MKQREGLLHPEGIEMTAPGRRQRSYSNDHAESSSRYMGGGSSSASGSKLSEGLKKRFGSLRKKKALPTQGVH
jgi:hypothetical protein